MADSVYRKIDMLAAHPSLWLERVRRVSATSDPSVLWREILGAEAGPTLGRGFSLSWADVDSATLLELKRRLRDILAQLSQPTTVDYSAEIIRIQQLVQ